MFENRLVPWQRRRPMPATMPRVFGGLQEEINRLFDDFWGEAATPLSGVRSSIVSPRVDLSESEDAYQISAEMPGLKEDEIEVNFSDGVLSIKGEHKAETEGWKKTGKAGNFHKQGLYGLPGSHRLALEMALHEEAERRAMQGELKELERAWQDAEEIASISDSLLLPDSVTKAFEKLKQGGTGETGRDG